MEINLNFLLGLAIAITITLLNTRLKFSKLGWKKFFLVAVILSNPWKIGKNVFSFFGGWNDEGSIYSLCPIFQKTSGHAFGVFVFGYQKAGKDAGQLIGLAYQKARGHAVQVIGISCQRAGGRVMQFLGLAYQDAERNAGQFLGLAYQKARVDAFQFFGLSWQEAGGNARQFLGLSWQEAEGEAWQVVGLRVFASGNTITRGTFLAIPPIASKEKGAIAIAP